MSLSNATQLSNYITAEFMQTDTDGDDALDFKALVNYLYSNYVGNRKDSEGRIPATIRVNDDNTTLIFGIRFSDLSILIVAARKTAEGVQQVDYHPFDDMREGALALAETAVSWNIAKKEDYQLLKLAELLTTLTSPDATEHQQ